MATRNKWPLTKKADKPTKYNNKKVEYHGITFDSTRERDRYLVLLDAERKGLISCLTIQPEFELIPAQYEDKVEHLKTKDKIVSRCVQRAITYRGDFMYEKDGDTVVEDVKISKTLLPHEFVLKEKMMYYFHRVKIKRVYNPAEPV